MELSDHHLMPIVRLACLIEQLGVPPSMVMMKIHLLTTNPPGIVEIKMIELLWGLRGLGLLLHRSDLLIRTTPFYGWASTYQMI